MKVADYQSRIVTEAGVLRTAAIALDPGTPVPTCPGWTVHRLVEHLGQVFDMVIRVIRTADPQSPPIRVQPPAGDVFAIFDSRLATLLDLLATTDPATPVWNFTPTAPKTAAFWSRRMAHEVTVHRIDAHAAAGTDSAVDPDFAADGIDEVLTRHIQRRTDSWSVGTSAGTVLYHAADAGRAWTVRLVPGQLPQTAAEAGTEPDGSVIGLADAVYRAAWGRPSGAVISGDTTLVDLTRAG
ncbi:MAG TPA: maleylpyruvate isomerase N-terminal domain-containing protein [Pseudonocardiaceae bacterium]|nr:maleylpyruvate isomerase N-terminal domain-containing protein [Pseudonocardiaceae bacterium]